MRDAKACFKIKKVKEKYANDTEVEIEFCWGKGKTNRIKAVLFINTFKKAVKENDFSALATAFNVPVMDAEPLSQYVSLLHILWHWDKLKKAEWVEEVASDA